MKMEKHTTQTSTALLRNASGVDTLETNSLCCTAAGIIAPLSATAEVLIPHEKLREADKPNATLIAHNCPPAQPAEGYKWCSKTSRASVTTPDRIRPFEKNRKHCPAVTSLSTTGIPFELLKDPIGGMRDVRSLLPPLVSLMDRLGWYFSPSMNLNCESKAHCGDSPQVCYQNHIHFCKIGDRDVINELVVHSPKLKVVDRTKERKMSSRILQHVQHTITLNSEPNCHPSQILVGVRSLAFFFVQLMKLWNKPRSQDCCNRTNRLHPRRRILTVPGPRKNPPANQYGQRRQRQSFHQCNDGNSYGNSFRQHAHLLAFNGGARLPHLPYKIHGVAAT